MRYFPVGDWMRLRGHKDVTGSEADIFKDSLFFYFRLLSYNYVSGLNDDNNIDDTAESGYFSH